MNADALFLDTIAQVLQSDTDLSGSPWLVAVSGGVDSMVLLHVARRVRDRFGGTCTAVHIHHGLRSASDEDERFVRRQCDLWGIPVEVRRLELASYLQQHSGANLEMVARNGRYEALRHVASARGAKSVWMGHHADDQLETMLWRLARGTSQSGLSGMKARFVRDGVVWLRPLLPHSRRDIESYAKLHQIPHVEDESNQSTAFTRNYIRQRVVPELRHGHPKVAEHAAHLATILQAEDEWLDEQARAVLHVVAEKTKAGFRLDVASFCRHPLPLQRRVIKILLYCLATENWTTRHIEAIVHLAHSESPSSSAQVSGSISARREYGILWIGRGLPTPPPARYQFGWKLSHGSRLDGISDAAAEWRFHCWMWDGGPVRSPSLWEAHVGNLDALLVQQADPGERVAPMGMSGTKKVQDVFTDAKVPKHVRWSWPVVADASGTIVWIPGIVRTRYYMLSSGDLSGWVIRAERTSLDEPSDENFGHIP